MRIVIFVPSNVHSLELAGLMDVFAEANARAAETFYEVTVVAEDDRPIRCGSGLRVLPDLAYRREPERPRHASRGRQRRRSQCAQAGRSSTG